jgi:hypothetical protein
VPRLLRARRPEDAEEERKIYKLAGSRHAPGDWILRARIISRSWQGLRNVEIAEELGCHPKTVRERIHRFDAEGLDVGSETAPAPGARGALRNCNARRSSRWSPRTHRASSSPSLMVCCVPRTRPKLPTGRWTRSPRLLGRRASRSGAAR